MTKSNPWQNTKRSSAVHIVAKRNRFLGLFFLLSPVCCLGQADVSVTPEGVTISSESVPGMRRVVEYSDSMSGRWDAFPGAPHESGPILDPAALGMHSRFYRVEYFPTGTYFTANAPRYSPPPAEEPLLHETFVEPILDQFDLINGMELAQEAGRLYMPSGEVSGVNMALFNQELPETYQFAAKLNLGDDNARMGICFGIDEDNVIGVKRRSLTQWEVYQLDAGVWTMHKAIGIIPGAPTVLRMWEDDGEICWSVQGYIGNPVAKPASFTAQGYKPGFVFVDPVPDSGGAEWMTFRRIPPDRTPSEVHMEQRLLFGDGTTYEAFPSIARQSNGDIVATWVGGPSNSNHVKNKVVRAARLTPSGTIDELVTLYGGLGEINEQSAYLSELSDGRIAMLTRQWDRDLEAFDVFVSVGHDVMTMTNRSLCVFEDMPPRPPWPHVDISGHMFLDPADPTKLIAPVYGFRTDRRWSSIGLYETPVDNPGNWTVRSWIYANDSEHGWLAMTEYDVARLADGRWAALCRVLNPSWGPSRYAMSEDGVHWADCGAVHTTDGFTAANTYVQMPGLLNAGDYTLAWFRGVSPYGGKESFRVRAMPSTALRYNPGVLGQASTVVTGSGGSGDNGYGTFILLGASRMLGITMAVEEVDEKPRIYLSHMYW